MALQTCPTPKFIDYAAPGNRQCGVCPTDLPKQLQAYCGRMTESVQGRNVALLRVLYLVSSNSIQICRQDALNELRGWRWTERSL